MSSSLLHIFSVVFSNVNPKRKRREILLYLVLFCPMKSIVNSFWHTLYSIFSACAGHFCAVKKWYNFLLCYQFDTSSWGIFVKGAQSWLNGLKSLAKFFNFVVCNPCQSSPSLTILVALWIIIVSLMFFYLCKVLFSGFLQFKGNIVYAQNNSKYHDWAPLILLDILAFISSTLNKRLLETWSCVFGYCA